MSIAILPILRVSGVLYLCGSVCVLYLSAGHWPSIGRHFSVGVVRPWSASHKGQINHVAQTMLSESTRTLRQQDSFFQSRAFHTNKTLQMSLQLALICKSLRGRTAILCKFLSFLRAGQTMRTWLQRCIALRHQAGCPGWNTLRRRTQAWQPKT